MDGLLQGLLIAGVAFWAAVALGGLWARGRLRRHLRIASGVRSCAPTSFLVSLAPAARLHRRLRGVGASARLASSIDPTLAAVADQLAGQALALEPPVVAAARTGRVGGTTRRALSAQIAELEGVARRLTSAANDTGDTATSKGTSGVEERLAALELARRELTEIDVRAGLHLQR